MATSLTPAATTMATVAKAWNEQMYYWSLDRAGLTQPLQYGWDPVALPNHSNTFQYVPLNIQPPLIMNAPPALWGSTAASGAFLAPVGQTTDINQHPVPPTSSSSTSFGAIGNAPPTSVAMTTNKQPSLQENVSETRANGGYSLFSSAQQTLFGKSLLPNGQENDTVAMDTLTCENDDDDVIDNNEGVSSPPQRNDDGGFDKWPAF